MDLRRQVFPSPAVTSANNTTSQNPSGINSRFGQPVTVSVQYNSSIRNIRPNIVKSRAQVFEKQDADGAKNLQPSKAVIAAKTNPSPSSVSTSVVRGHSIVKPSKSADHLEHVGVSSVPFMRPREKTAEFSSDNERSTEWHDPPLPPHRYLRQGQSTDRDVLPDKPSDVVTRRLQMFENRPVVSNKPSISPKPRSPCPDSGADFVAIYRSKSTDSLKRSEVYSGVKASFCFPPGDRVSQLDDRSSRLYSQDSALKTPTKSSNIPCPHDAVAKRKGSYREVKEVVVISPSAPHHVNETVVSNQLPPSGPDTSKVISPKPPQKPHVKEAISRSINPMSASPETGRTASPKLPEKPRVKETVVCSPLESSRPISIFPPPSSTPETSKVVVPKPPEKPPRMMAVRPRPVTPANDSYGLLVYAAGQERMTPSVRVEKLGSGVNASPPQKIGGKLVADRRSCLESQGDGYPSAPEAVLSSSRLQDSNAVRSNVTAQSPSVADAWDKKFIRAPKNAPVVRSQGEKENFVSKRRMNNPNYMYVSVYVDDIIPSQQKAVKDKQSLTRHHSDDMLNMVPPSSHPQPKSPRYKEPLYAVPYEAANDTYQVAFDSAGYAMPYLANTPQLKVMCYSCGWFLIQYCLE